MELIAVSLIGTLLCLVAHLYHWVTECVLRAPSGTGTRK